MNTLLQRRTASHQFLCAFLAGITALGPAAQLARAGDVDVDVKPPRPTTLIGDLADAPAAKLNIQYATPGATLVVAIRPAQVLSSDTVAMYPVEVLQAALVKESGLDPLAAEQLVLSVSPPLQGPPAYSLFTQFSAPAKLKNGKMLDHTQPESIGGRTYHKSAVQDPMAPSVLEISDDSLLAAPDFIMSKLLEEPAESRVNPLAVKLAAADQGDDLLAMVDAKALRPFIFMALGHAELPEELQPLLQVPNLVNLVELRVNVSRPGNTELIVVANDEDDAEQLVQLFDDAKARLKAEFLRETQKGLASDDPVEQAGAKYAQRMAKAWDEQFQLTREESRLILFRTDLSENGGAPMASVAAVGLMAALLLPAIQAAREAARRNASMNNMKQIMIAMLNYESVHAALPAHANYDDNGKPLLSWRVHILPYMEEQALYDQFHLDEPWDSEHNKQLIPLMPEIYLDPSSGMDATDGKTHYLGVAGEGRVFDGTENGRKLKSITDGLSNTIAVMQLNDDATAVWTKPADWQPAEDDLTAALGGIHPRGNLAAFCDGHVTFISQMVDADVLKALLTIAGGESIDHNDY